MKINKQAMTKAVRAALQIQMGTIIDTDVTLELGEMLVDQWFQFKVNSNISNPTINGIRTQDIDGQPINLKPFVLYTGFLQNDGTDYFELDDGKDNVDRVDGLHFRDNSGILEISTNNVDWTPVSMTASDILTALKTVDGTGSGLDSDMVDGLHFRDNAGILEISTNNVDWTPVSMTASDILTALKTVDGTGSGLDADKLDGEQGSYYLDFTNMTNKPDPTITLAGDLSGSVTLTDLGNDTLTATVADNSHNHTIANVTGLQTALDDKLLATAYTAEDVLTKIKTVDGIGSGLDADTLDAQQGSYYLDFTNFTNKPDPTITLAGDLTGSVTLTDLGNATLTVSLASSVSPMPTITNLNADKLDNYHASESASASTVVVRNSASNIFVKTVFIGDMVSLPVNSTTTKVTISPATDQDTGINFPSSGVIEFVSNSSVRARVHSTGLDVVDGDLKVKNWTIKENTDGSLGFYYE